MKIPSDRSLVAKHPELAAEWHPQKNGSLRPSDVYAGSGKKVWWRCTKGHEWEAKILNRRHGRGCPVCSGRVLNEETSLQSQFPEIAREWHSSKNGDLRPEQVFKASGKKVWWLCPQGHEYEAIVGNRTQKRTGCPYCSNQKVNNKNCLSFVSPELAAEWHPTKNGDLTPDMVVAGGHKKVWWRCEKNHSYQATLDNRFRNKSGCPYCTRQSSSMELRIFSELESFFPDVASRHRIEGYELDVFIPSLSLGLEFDGSYYHDGREEYDLAKTTFFEQSGIRLLRVRQKPLEKLAPQDVLVGSKELTKEDVTNIFNGIAKFTGTKAFSNYAFIECFINDTKYKTYLANSLGANQKNNIQNLFPHLDREWDQVRNHPLRADQFSKGSDYSAWWLCDKGHSWQATISSRTDRRKVGCPVCKGIKPSKENNLAVLHAHLIKEWHESKNIKTPDQVLPQSHEKVWWRCSANPEHEWQASVSNRVGSLRRKGTGCPKCYQEKPYERKPIPYEKSLAALMPELASQWHPTKNNDLSPSDFTTGSNKKVFWLCAKGHTWPASIKNRKNGRGCPVCCKYRKFKGNPHG